MVKDVIAKLGAVGILVNTTAGGSHGKFFECGEENWGKAIDRGLKAYFLTCQLFGKEVARRGKGGKIINITSIVGVLGSGEASVPWGVARRGVNALTSVIAQVWVPTASTAPGSPVVRRIRQPAAPPPRPSGCGVCRAWMESFFHRPRAQLAASHTPVFGTIAKCAATLQAYRAAGMTGVIARIAADDVRGQTDLLLRAVKSALGGHDNCGAPPARRPELRPSRRFFRLPRNNRDPRWLRPRLGIIGRRPAGEASM